MAGEGVGSVHHSSSSSSEGARPVRPRPAMCAEIALIPHTPFPHAVPTSISSRALRPASERYDPLPRASTRFRALRLASARFDSLPRASTRFRGMHSPRAWIRARTCAAPCGFPRSRGSRTCRSYRGSRPEERKEGRTPPLRFGLGGQGPRPGSRVQGQGPGSKARVQVQGQGTRPGYKAKVRVRVQGPRSRLGLGSRVWV